MHCLMCNFCCCDSKEHGHACVLTEMEKGNDPFKQYAMYDGFQWVIPYIDGKCPFLTFFRGCVVHGFKPESCRKYFCEYVRKGQ
jgi:hypothetical protein